MTSYVVNSHLQISHSKTHIGQLTSSLAYFAMLLFMTLNALMLCAIEENNFVELFFKK
jgi:hypothetical protein